MNRKLTEQSKTISKQYKELHRKFSHFEKNDLKKYQEIKEMNLLEIDQMKKKILDCDQIIMSQLLGFLVQKPVEKEAKLETMNTDLTSRISERNMKSMANEENALLLENLFGRDILYILYRQVYILG